MDLAKEEEHDQTDEIGWSEALGVDADNPATPRASGESMYIISCSKCDQMFDPCEADENGKYPGSLCKTCNGPRKIIKYTFSSLEQGIKAQFEGWVRDGALLAIAEAYDQNPVMASRMQDTYMANRREYTWNGMHVRVARTTWTGYAYLLYLLIRRCHPNVTEPQAAKILETNPKGWGMVWSWAQGNSEAPAVEGAQHQANGKQKKSSKETEPATMDSR